MRVLTCCYVALIAGATLIFTGCGGGEEAPTPIADESLESPAPQPRGKQSSGVRSVSSGAAANSASAYDRIDAALDKGDYMGAVNVAIKSGGNPTENMEYLRHVQTQLGDPMARGDAKATEAYNKLNAFYMMKYQR